MHTGSAKMCRFCMALLRIKINTSVKLLNAIARYNNFVYVNENHTLYVSMPYV